jgi:hypothetical protein
MLQSWFLNTQKIPCMLYSIVIKVQRWFVKLKGDAPTALQIVLN